MTRDAIQNLIALRAAAKQEPDPHEARKACAAFERALLAQVDELLALALVAKEDDQ